jgi:uncharacterized SAM-binding protein YcdF (DUF218 family)
VKRRGTENILKRLGSVLKCFLVTTGSIAAVMIILAFTSAPFWIWYGLGTKKAGISRPPDYIVLLGGGGMPSESGLMRTWYAAGAAGYFTRSAVIIALPGDPSSGHSAISLMKAELVLRGIAPDRIVFEDSGTNTRSQALNIFKRITNNEYRISNIERNQPSTFALRPSSFNSSLLIVTSPEHLYRAVLAFKKAGFLKVEGVPAFEQSLESEITFNSRKLGGRTFIPGIGSNITLRYQFWTQMNYELLILREYTALAYYKIKGWI